MSLTNGQTFSLVLCFHAHMGRKHRYCLLNVAFETQMLFLTITFWEAEQGVLDGQKEIKSCASSIYGLPAAGGVC